MTQHRDSTTREESTGERRVVVTGLGVVAANGIGKDAFWDASSRGVSGIHTIERFSPDELPLKVAGEVRDFVATNYIERKLANRTDRATHFVLAAVQEALQDAKVILTEENPHRVGAVIANTLGGVEYVLEQMRSLYVRGPRAMSAFSAIAWLQVANVGQTSIRYGIQGYCKTPLNDAVGGLDALGMAYSAIQRGAADMLITGGCEAMLHPFILTVMAHSDHCITGDDPTAYRPFDRRAAGLLVARDVAQLRYCFHLVEYLRRPLAQLVEIGVLQRVLILRPGRAAADIDVLCRLQKECRAFDFGELRTQPSDDLVRKQDR